MLLRTQSLEALVLFSDTDPTSICSGDGSLGPLECHFSLASKNPAAIIRLA